jgi:hypothetical protein
MNEDFTLYNEALALKELGFDEPIKELKKSINRLSRKRKAMRINSFVLFKSKNKSKHFFHSINKFIFIESPRLNCAVFYFLEDTFEDINQGYKKAMSIIKKNY